mgnify:CR=1 FL=1
MLGSPKLVQPLEHFQVVTVPITHELCGPVVYFAESLANDVVQNTVSLGQTTFSLDVEGSDRNLIGEHVYSVLAALDHYRPATFD